MNRADETYQVHAIKYAHHGERHGGDNFIHSDPHEQASPLDYFIWAIVGPSRVFVVDTGFSREMAGHRGRLLTNPIEAGLAAIGIRPADVDDVIITHMHYDHAGNRELFPRARYHVQDREMAYCTGRCMCHGPLRFPYDADDVARMVRRVYDGRVEFHDGDASLTSGLSLHRIGGHTDGLQAVRVRTERGWICLASDASHLYANLEQTRPFPAVLNVADMLEGYRRLVRLADQPAGVIPGHDPLVLKRYTPPRPELDGWIVRLDVPRQAGSGAAAVPEAPYPRSDLSSAS